MANVTLKFIGLDALKKQLKAKGKMLAKEIDAEVEQGVEKMRASAVRKAPFGAGGFLQKGIVKEQQSIMNWGLFSNAEYSGYVEFGTKGNYQSIPGYEDVAAEIKANPIHGSHEDFIRSLTMWVHAKGLAGRFSVKTRRRLGNKKTQESEDRQVAEFLAMLIHIHGIKPHPFFFSSVEENKDELIRNIENVLKQV